MEEPISDLFILKQSLLFSGLPEEQLNRLLKDAERLSLNTGEALLSEGSLPDAFYVVLDGDFEIGKGSAGQEIVVSSTHSGEILGEMSLIENVPRRFTVRALRPSEVLKISAQVFDEVIFSNPSCSRALLQTVMSRLRIAESMMGQQERLASLGTLAAGLAHELNNPAAAARRDASQLRQTVNDWLNLHNELDELHLEPEVREIVLSRLRQDLDHDTHPVLLPDPLERSDREDEIQNWLEEIGVDDAWTYAPLLVSFNWEPEALKHWCAQFAPYQIPVIIGWLATGYSVHTLLDEIYNASDRISEIVAAVKTYSHLDQAPQKEIDIHEGLENTLVILKYKLKQGVVVRRDYDRSLPRITAYGGELNQVWTNLIDNAIDAMQGQGELRLKTSMENGMVLVEIGDNGPGIPGQVLTHIFEPFYTTKEPGSGTGLGLHVTHSIVQKHYGRIEVFSEPGNTVFKVRLPLNGK